MHTHCDYHFFDDVRLPKRLRLRRDNAVKIVTDNPLIADLDKDGLLDVILTDHAHAANIMWNNGDKFSAPQLLIGGDTALKHLYKPDHQA